MEYMHSPVEWCFEYHKLDFTDNLTIVIFYNNIKITFVSITCHSGSFYVSFEQSEIFHVCSRGPNINSNSHKPNKENKNLQEVWGNIIEKKSNVEQG